MGRDFDADAHNRRVQAWRDKEAAESAAKATGSERKCSADSAAHAKPFGSKPATTAIVARDGLPTIKAADTRASGRATLGAVATALEASLGHANPFVVVPWPPSGNTAVRHANGAHYLTDKVKDYRKAVLARCEGRGGVHGQFRLNVHFSPPDARARDMDNAMKSLFDALVPAGFIPADSMTYMRELWVTVDDKRLGTVAVEAIPLGKEVA